MGLVIPAALVDSESTRDMLIPGGRLFEQRRATCDALDKIEGVSYVENFMGYSTLFLLSDPDIARGTVVACPVENIDLYYIDPGDSEFARLGLNYTTAGETNLIGFHAEGNYSTAVGESYALMGMTLWAEYLDGIAVINVGTESFSAVTSPTGNPAAQKYYEKAADNSYFRTTDETVVNGKTYYSRTVTAGA